MYERLRVQNRNHVPSATTYSVYYGTGAHLVEGRSEPGGSTRRPSPKPRFRWGRYRVRTGEESRGKVDLCPRPSSTVSCSQTGGWEVPSDTRTCTYTYIQVRTHVQTLTDTRTNVHMHTQGYTYLHIPTRVSTYTHLHKRTHVNVRTHTYVRAQAHTCTYVHPCTHPLIHTRIGTTFFGRKTKTINIQTRLGPFTALRPLSIQGRGAD